MTRTLLQQALDALENVTQFAEAQICMHEETYRGGVLWEICSQCGAKWADDEGGKPKFKWPKETNAARKTITAIRSALAAPQPEPVALCDALRWSGAKESHGAMMFSPDQLRKFYEFALAAPPAAPADMVMVPRKELGDGISLLHQAMVGACDCLAKTHEASYHAESCFYCKLSKQCDKLEATLAAAPAPAVPDDAALNTLAKLFHNGEEIEGDNGAAMMVDMALWHEASEAFDSLIGEGDDETLASSAAPVVREPQYWCPETGELCGKCAKTGTCEASILQAHGIGGGGK